MKHKLNSKGQAGTTADACKNAENLMSSKPIANAHVGCCPVRVQRKRAKGWKMPENTVYVGRGTKWGNPFKIVPVKFGWHVVAEEDGKELVILKTDDYEKAIKFSLESYQYWLMPYTHEDGDIEKFFLSISQFDSVVFELKGKNLACWCKIMNHGNYCNCHADILLALANDIPMLQVKNENIKNYSVQILRDVNG